MLMKKVMIPTWHYSQFDADYTLEVPAEGYTGWQKRDLPINPAKTALVIMHSWDTGTYEEFPGWHKAVEYIPRAKKICDEVFPVLLTAVRKAGMKIIHITNGAEYGARYPGHQITQEICSRYPSPDPENLMGNPESDEVHSQLVRFKSDYSFPGAHNMEDIAKGKVHTGFGNNTEPVGSEPVVSDSNQLHAVCLEYGINHLIYTGFAINWCLQHAPGNMNDMHNRGFLCSAVREAVTAVENKISARTESNKEHGLWVTAVQNGFVYDLDDFLYMLKEL